MSHHASRPTPTSRMVGKPWCTEAFKASEEVHPMADSLYNVERRMTRVIENVKTSASLSDRKKQLILEYKDEMLANGLSKGRAVRFTYYMIRLAEWLPCEFEEADLATIKALVSRIEASDYVPFSKMEHKLALRRFYKWLRGTEDYPREVKWIPMRLKASDRTKLPEELLTERDVQALIRAAQRPRDRAFVAVLYESGCRVSELGLLRLKHVQFDTCGARLLVRGKTGSRRVLIISSAPLLAAWINVHPRSNEPDAYVWTTNRGSAPRYNTITSMLDRLAERAGVRKPVNPHAFRHARATHLANHLTEAQMKEYFGWVQASEMAAVYVHLSGRDVDDALLRVHGIKKEEHGDEESTLRPKACPRCKTQNPFSNRFCSLCGLPLDEKASTKMLQDRMNQREADAILDTMLDDPAFRQHFHERLNSLVQAKVASRNPSARVRR